MTTNNLKRRRKTREKQHINRKRAASLEYATGEFDLGALFLQERARVDAQLDMIRLQVALLQEDRVQSQQRIFLKIE